MAMAVNVVSSLVATLLVAGATVVWRSRHDLSLLRATLYPRGIVRVSFAAVLRVKDDDRFVLIRTSTRPGFFGPPGGVFKHHADATAALDAVGFRAQRFSSHRDNMHADLRGFVPAGSLGRFVRWFVSGADRETAAECLRRELAEEVAGHIDATLAGAIAELAFRPVRTVMEGPRRVPGQSFRQLRRFEVYDLATADPASARLHRRLIELGKDPAVTTILGADSSQIAAGWCGNTPIAPQAAYLFGTTKLQPDLPPMP
jgi:ADP-ribose pyrophosphatase YjhB (NUDIX family)